MAAGGIAMARDGPVKEGGEVQKLGGKMLRFKQVRKKPKL